MILKVYNLLVLVLLLAIIPGCVSEITAWNEAVKYDTIDAYEEFLRCYPQSEYGNEAHRRIEDEHLLYIVAMECSVDRDTNTKAIEINAAYEEFLQRYPQSVKGNAVRLRMEALDFDKMKVNRTIAAYEEFLQKYPQGNLSPIARKELELLKEEMPHLKASYDEAIKQRSIAAFSRYIRQYPQSPFVPEAISKIWDILSKDFPEDTNTCSRTLINLREFLPRAISKNMPFLVAFTPKIVHREQGWSVKSTFFELAGQPTTLNYMNPFIDKPGVGYYRLPPNKNGMVTPLHIEAYGKGSSTWWCRGDFGGSEAHLSYSCEQGTTSIYTLVDLHMTLSDE